MAFTGVAALVLVGLHFVISAVNGRRNKANEDNRKRKVLGRDFLIYFFSSSVIIFNCFFYFFSLILNTRTSAILLFFTVIMQGAVITLLNFFEPLNIILISPPSFHYLGCRKKDKTKLTRTVEKRKKVLGISSLISCPDLSQHRCFQLPFNTGTNEIILGYLYVFLTELSH